MRLNIIKAYMLKEFVELYRSKLIVIVYILPSMILLLFGYGIRMEVTHARTIIIDNDNSRFSRNLSEKFFHSKYFNVVAQDIDEQKALGMIKKARADIVIIIPQSFEKRILHNQNSEIGVFIDGAYPMRAMTMESYVEGVILDAVSDEAESSGVDIKRRFAINQRTLFNQSMRDADAIVPGLIGLVMLVAPAILAALLVVREKEKGTIFNFYSSSVKRGEFLLAKMIPAFLLHSVNIFILFLIAVYIFDVPFRGSFILYWSASEIYIIISLSIGLLVSVVTNRQIVAVVLTIIITIIPGFLYSGILMPISSMKEGAVVEAHIFPVMYYNQIVYDTFLVAQGLASAKNVEYLAILTIYAIVILTLATLLMKKEVK